MKNIPNGVQKFETLEELVDHLIRGDEIEFRYKNHNYYTTLGGPGGKRILYRCNDSSQSEYVFDNIEDFLQYSLDVGDNHKIQDIFSELQILDTLFH